MRIYGLTGGIASGKSTVHTMLAELGAHVLDADAIYHRLVAPVNGTASRVTSRIGERFPGVVKTDGTLDRAALGRIVFADPAQRRELELITHPEVAAQFALDVDELALKGITRVFYDVPLLYERGLEKGMEGVVVVWVPRDVQRARLMARDNLDSAAADARLAAQLSLDEKRAKATWVIDNSDDREHTRRQVEKLWAELRAAPATA
jgi:dephospho-CoA kinase